MDFDVELSFKIDGKIQNILSEDNIRRPYKPTSKYEL